MWRAISSFCALAGISLWAQAADETPAELVDQATARAHQQQILEAARETVEGVRRLTDDQMRDLAEWARKVESEVVHRPGEYTPANEVIDAVAGDPGFVERHKQLLQEQRQAQTGTEGEPIYVLTSLGLPEAMLRDYMEQARSLKRPVVFVLRGFDPDQGGLQAVVQRILELSRQEVPFEFQILPQLFRQTDTLGVPTIVANDTAGVPKIRRGAVSLYAALESIEQNDQLEVRLGDLFPIAEPDLIEVLQNRAKNIDAEALLAGARQRATQRMTVGDVELPEATQDETYLIDPTLTLRRDITLPEGQLVAEAGSVVNPLQLMPWTRQYVIFDATSSWQVAQAQAWAREEDTVFIATRLPAEPEAIAELGQRLGDHVNLLDPLIARRMALKAVPSRVRQNGLQIEVEVRSQETSDG